MTLELSEVCIPLSDVARYVGRTPQAVSGYIRKGLLKKKDYHSVTLASFNRFLGRKFPRLQRFESVEQYDRWNANGRPTANL
jgi:hypothetical protein